MNVTTTWDDRWLREAVKAAVRPAAEDVADAARRNVRSRRVKAGIKVRSGIGQADVVSTHPLGAIVEGGARPHPIAPRVARAMRFPDGGFASGAVRHPGQKAEPFLRPAASVFPAAYNRHARARLPR